MNTAEFSQQAQRLHGGSIPMDSTVDQPISLEQPRIASIRMFAFNPEKDPAKRKHNVLLVDEKRELLLIGFEDLHREQRPDDDFNDAVFYATVTPYRAIKDGIYKKIDTPTDTDNDGVSDTMDEYPNDPERAYNNYYPSKSQVGTLAFEDMWPAKGDYDFNDLVVDYRYNQITNAANKVVEIEADITLRAAGASLRNAFAIAFNTEASNVEKVTGQNLSGEVFKLSETGVEMNQKFAVVPVFDNPFRVLGLNGSIINTVNGSNYVTPAIIKLSVLFKEPVDFKVLGTPPYNPFIVVGGERGREIHLPGSEPTQLADFSLFGTGDDNTEPGNGKYYMSDTYLPWAINIPVQFAYPAEKEDITKAYLVFNNWAKSRGFNYMDWYMDKSNYRDVKRFFLKK
jgi:LruC domain-containing protein